VRTYLFVLVAAAALPALGLILFRDHELRQTSWLTHGTTSCGSRASPSTITSG